MHSHKISHKKEDKHINAIFVPFLKGEIIMLDIYKEITDRIISALEQGTIPWHKPWIGGNNGCISYSTGKPYSLLNHILLGGQSGEYITYKQATLAGGHVRKGEKSKYVVFWKPYEIIDQETGEVTKHFYLRYYNVFHLDQVEGISPRWAVSVRPSADLQPDALADTVIKDYVDRSGVKLQIIQSDRAYYQPGTDTVVVPELIQYQRQEEFYSTAFHELVHSTGHTSRLDRLTDIAAFGSHEYSKEELVAELGSAFLVNHCGLESTASFRNSAGYIQGWLSALKNDKKLIISAAGAAAKAVNLILDRKEGDPCVGTDE